MLTSYQRRAVDHEVRSDLLEMELRDHLFFLDLQRMCCVETRVLCRVQLVILMEGNVLLYHEKQVGCCDFWCYLLLV